MPESIDIAGWPGQYPEVIALILVAGGWILAYFARRWVASAVLWINERSTRWTPRSRSVLAVIIIMTASQYHD